jgi:hypothetical protein
MRILGPAVGEPIGRVSWGRHWHSDGEGIAWHALIMPIGHPSGSR